MNRQIKITDVTVADAVHEDAHILVTQHEEIEGGETVESLRRVPVDVLLGDIRQEIADMKYTEIRVTGASLSPSVAMLGAVVTKPVLKWTLSRAEAAQWVDGEMVEVGLRSMELARELTASDNAATVKARDERGAEHSATAKISFYNAVYYTSHWSGEGLPTDAELIAMLQKLQDSLGLTINAAAGAGEYVLYACPARLGTPEFWCNGFQGGFEKLGSFLHTNAEGYVESYDVWLSNAAGLTGVAITVK